MRKPEGKRGIEDYGIEFLSCVSVALAVETMEALFSLFTGPSKSTSAPRPLVHFQRLGLLTPERTKAHKHTHADSVHCSFFFFWSTFLLYI